ncbi:MAG: IS4 family transposase [Verrucomicrobiota bacterium]
MPIKKRRSQTRPNPSPRLPSQPGLAPPDLRLLLASFLNLLPGRRLRRLPSLAQTHFYDRLFNPIVTLWYLIFQRLHLDSTLQAALADAWAGGADRLRRGLSRKLRSLATTALSDARQRLPLAFLQEVLGLQAQRIVGLEAQTQWRGLGLRLMDGSTLRLRPYGDIPQQFPPHRNQSRQPAYWCLVRVVVLFCLHTGAAVGYAAGSLSVSEQVLAARLILENPGRFLYIGDRNFGIFRIVQTARAAGAQVLVRLSQPRARRLRGRSLRLGIFDVLWRPTRDDQPQEGCSSDPVQGRLLVVRVQRPGFRPQTLYLFTSLEAAYPAQELVALYGLRWHIELNLRYLKTQMHLGQLECKSATMAEKEWVAGLLAYNLIRAVMLCAALKAGLKPLQLSFSAARRHFQHWLEDFGRGQIPGLRRWKTLLVLVGQSRLPHRPLGRPPEPRAQRHVRQSFPLLFGSRSQARRQLKKYQPKN